MKNTLRQVFHSPKFVTGFVIFVGLLLIMLIYPLFNPGNPLEMIGVGTFAKPGTYVSLYDAVGTAPETLRLSDADDKRIARSISDEDRVSMIEWLGLAEVDLEGVDASDTEALLEVWNANYDDSVRPKGMTKAKRNYYRLHVLLNYQIIKIMAFLRLMHGLHSMPFGEDGCLPQNYLIKLMLFSKQREFRIRPKMKY